VAATATLLVALAAACSSDAAPTPTPALPDANDFRTRTVDALRGITSVRFDVSHEEGGTDLGGGVLLTTVHGEARFPDGASMTAQGIAFNVAVKFGIVQLGGVTYFCGPIGCAWREVEPGSLPFNFAGMHESVADALAAATGLAIEEGGEVNGVATYLLTGLMLSQDIRSLVPNTPGGLPIVFRAWAGKDDALVRAVELAGRLIEEDPPTMVRLLELRDFNDEVTVEPPI
jgi:hypothetical protein